MPEDILIRGVPDELVESMKEFAEVQTGGDLELLAMGSWVKDFTRIPIPANQDHDKELLEQLEGVE